MPHPDDVKQTARQTIRLSLFTGDSKLAMSLTSVLGPEFVFIGETCGGRAWQQPPAGLIDALVLDLNRPDDPKEQSNSLFAELMPSGIPVIVMAGDEDRSYALRLIDRGAHGYVRKPPSIRELKTLLRSACESQRLKRELQVAKHQLENASALDDLIGGSPPMQGVYRLVRKVANLEAPVLITGESGTGKELISRAIHNTGNRAKRPFVAVSCSAIPDTLVESELFGHEKGAFTGSAGMREGYFEQAGDGTLFLDEIGELKPQTQVKLLRVLQQREFNRLGSARVLPLRARVILATHRDLGQMVAAGEFRRDLYYRVNVVNIHAPALRQRISDIPVLAQHFVMKYAEKYGKPVENVDPTALLLLQRYTWEGNVRELENAIQHAIIVAEGYSIETTDLPETIQDYREDDSPPNGSFERLLRDYKIKLATEAIRQNRGNKTLAAQSLGISRAYLHRLIRSTQEPGGAEIRGGDDLANFKTAG